MPLEFTINHKDGYLTCKYLGQITDEEIVASWQKFYEGNKWIPGFNELNDLSEADFMCITTSGLRRLAQLSKTMQEKMNIQELKVAIYAPTPLQFGLSRVYEVLAGDSPEIHKIFKDLDEAKAWLKTPAED
ncbi:MAG: hypothetical protein JXR46_14000 [Calditrichaceae bacterium]|nr:hypothetical protein [Calditrichaceae bacterium]MBN2710150.1 hypothetical protein [Calditrichaceae bacterium]RQV95803.1 MAG: hypothetical protein EH224_06415 [Calditrichota bacterium]